MQAFLDRLQGRPRENPKATTTPQLTTLDQKALENRETFRKYVVEITQQQRNLVMNRVDMIARHQQRRNYLAVACVGGCVLACWIGLNTVGPRHALKHKMYGIRPFAPAACIGCVLFSITFHIRLLLMKLRFWHMLEDFEYEVRKAEVHHVSEGVQHLAWLHFILEQVKADRAHLMDLEKVRKGPQASATTA